MMFRLWSKWEIGQGNKIFATPEAGEAWLRANPVVAEMAADEQLTVDEYIDTCFNDWGYFAWETLEVIQLQDGKLYETVDGERFRVKEDCARGSLYLRGLR